MKSEFFKNKENLEKFKRFFQEEIGDNDPLWDMLPLHLVSHLAKSNADYVTEIKDVTADYLELYKKNVASNTRTSLTLDLANIISIGNASAETSDPIGVMMKRFFFLGFKNLQHFGYALPGIIYFSKKPKQIKPYLTWMRDTQPEGFAAVIKFLCGLDVTGEIWRTVNAIVLQEMFAKNAKEVQPALEAAQSKKIFTPDEEAIIARDVLFLEGESDDDREYEINQIQMLADVVYEDDASLVSEKNAFIANLKNVLESDHTISSITFEDVNEHRTTSTITDVIIASKLTTVRKASLLTFLTSRGSNTVFPDDGAGKSLNIFELAQKYNIFEGYPEDHLYQMCYILLASAQRREMQAKLRAWLDSEKSLAVTFRLNYIEWLLKPTNEFVMEPQADHSYSNNLVLLLLLRSQAVYTKILQHLADNPERKEKLIEFIDKIPGYSNVLESIIARINFDEKAGVTDSGVATKTFRSIFWTVMYKNSLKSADNLKSFNQCIAEHITNLRAKGTADDIDAVLAARVPGFKIAEMAVKTFLSNKEIQGKYFDKFTRALQVEVFTLLMAETVAPSDLSRSIAAVVTLNVTGNQLMKYVKLKRFDMIPRKADLTLMSTIVKRDWNHLRLEYKQLYVHCLDYNYIDPKTMLGDALNPVPALPSAQVPVMNSTITEREKSQIAKEMKYISVRAEMSDDDKISVRETLANFLYDHLSNKSQFKSKAAFRKKCIDDDFIAKNVSNELYFNDQQGENAPLFEVLCNDASLSIAEKASLIIHVAIYAPTILIPSSTENIFVLAERKKLFHGFPEHFEETICFAAMTTQHSNSATNMAQTLGMFATSYPVFYHRYISWFMKLLDNRTMLDCDRVFFSVWVMLISPQNVLMLAILKKCYQDKALLNEFADYAVDNELDFKTMKSVIDDYVKNMTFASEQDHEVVLKQCRALYWAMLLSMNEVEANSGLPVDIIESILASKKIGDEIEAAFHVDGTKEELSKLFFDFYVQSKKDEPELLTALNDFLSPDLLSTVKSNASKMNVARRINLLIALKATAADLINATCVLNAKNVVFKSEEINLMMPIVVKAWGDLSWDLRTYFLLAVPKDQLPSSSVRSKMNDVAFAEYVSNPEHADIADALSKKHVFIPKLIQRLIPPVELPKSVEPEKPIESPKVIEPPVVNDSVRLIGNQQSNPQVKLSEPARNPVPAKPKESAKTPKPPVSKPPVPKPRVHKSFAPPPTMNPVIFSPPPAPVPARPVAVKLPVDMTPVEFLLTDPKLSDELKNPQAKYNNPFGVIGSKRSK